MPAFGAGCALDTKKMGRQSPARLVGFEGSYLRTFRRSHAPRPTEPEPSIASSGSGEAVCGNLFPLLSLAGAFWSELAVGEAAVSVLLPLVPCAPADGSVLEGVALWSVLGGVAFWSVVVVVFVVLFVVDVPVPLLPVCASATAPESTRIAMMLSVFFIDCLPRRRFDSASASNIRRSVKELDVGWPSSAEEAYVNARQSWIHSVLAGGTAALGCADSGMAQPPQVRVCHPERSALARSRGT
jgi:hypothetical protein